MMKSCKSPEEGATCKIFLTEAQIEDGNLVVYGQEYGELIDQFTALSNDLQVHGPRLRKLPQPKPDEPCVCKFKADDQWYRALTSRQLASGAWIVKFVDYGNCEQVTADELHVLPEKLAVLPQQVLSMVLDDSIRPVGTAAVWTPVVTNLILNSLMYSDVFVKVLKVISPGFVKVECAEIEKVLCESGYTEKGLIYPYVKYFPGWQFKAYASNILNDGTIYLQELESATELDQLMDKISRHFAARENKIPLTKKNLLPGTLMAAIYSQDQGVYRAQILDVDGDSATVKYIDYGDSEQQELVNMFVLPKQFCELEYQAIPCALDEFILAPGCGSPKVRKVLSDCTVNSILDVTVVKQIFNENVQLEVKVLQAGTNICIFALAAGFVSTKPSTKCQLNKEEVQLQCSEMAIGKTYKMFVTHVEDDGKIYLTDVEKCSELDLLMEGIKQHCDDEKAEKIISLAVGTPCLAMYEVDETWYRAKVIEVSADDVVVRYVDYGNTSKMKATALKAMQNKFTELNCQAVPCCMVNGTTESQVETLKSLLDLEVEVQFLGQQSDGDYTVQILHKGSMLNPTDPLPSESCTSPELRFKSFVLKVGNVIVIEVIQVISAGNFWAHCLENEGDYITMIGELNACQAENLEQPEIGQVCAAFDTVTNKWQRGKILSCMGDGKISVFLVDHGRSIVCANDQVRGLSSKFAGLPSQAIKCSLDENMSAKMLHGKYNLLVKGFSQETSSYKVEIHGEKLGRNGLSATVMSASTLTLTSVGSTEKSSSLGNLYSTCVALGTFVKVNVCFVEDVDCLWVQQGCNEKQLYDLMSNMKSYYSQLSQNQEVLKDIKTDKLCCTGMCHDNNEIDWYRGRILCSYGDVVEIKLIDFGNDITVGKSDVKSLASQFFELKAQALKCQLNNVQPPNRKWSKSALRQLKDLVLASGGKTLGRFVRKQNLTYLVDLAVEINAEKQDVARAMCDSGNAVLLQETINNISQQVVQKPPSVESSKTQKMFYRSRGLAMVGAELKVIPCTSKSPDEFFLQIVDLAYRQKYIKLFRKFHEALKKDPPAGVTGDLYVGKPCTVFNEKSADWCRAAILHYSDLDSVSVCLVDLGRIKTVKFHDLKNIDLAFVAAEPPAALRCTLHGTVIPNDGQWSIEAIKLFTDFFHQNTGDLVCTIHGCLSDTIGMAFMCSLRTPSTNIAMELKNEGFCQQIPVLGTLMPPLWLKSFIYSNLDVARGKEDIFYITHVESSTLFYCQLERNFAAFDMMMDQLQAHCANDTSPMMTLEEITQDCMCFAKYRSEQWCRAHFITLLPDGNIQILFVDYGNIDSVCWGEVKRYSGDQFYQLPIMALPCCLSDSTLFESNSDLSLQVCSKMKETVLERLYTGMVTGCTNGKLHLDLFDNGKRINDEITGQLPTSMVVKKASASSSSDTDEDVINSRLRAELSEPFCLRVGAKEPVALLNCISPHHFYVQLKQLDKDKVQCEEKVDGFYTAVRNADYPVYALSPGDTVCAWQSGVSKWSRATVLNVAQPIDDQVEVLFVDSGQYGKVDKSKHVKQLVGKMLKWPKMAVAVSLAGIQPKTSNSNWMQDAVVQLNDLLKTDTLNMQFLHKQDSGTWMVKLLAGDDDIAQILVERDIACWNMDECRVFNLNPQEEVIVPTYFIAGQTYEVYISHVDCHDTVFVQKVETFRNLKTMMSEINKEVDSLEQFYSVPNAGDLCLAKYSLDGLIYRARVTERILSNYADKTTLFIQFIDYGNGCGVTLNSTYHCPAKYLKQQEFAVRCKVLNIPSELSKDEAFLKLGDLSVSEDITLLCSTNSFDSSEKCHKINLKVKTSQGPTMSLPGFWSTDSTKSQDMPDNNDLPCYKPIESLEGQSNKQVYISHVVNPGEVYCQLSENYDQLETLTSSISSYYAEHINDQNDVVSRVQDLAVGDSCIAKFSIDENWYRALVTNVIDDKSLTVRFVDYGNEETVMLQDIRHSKVGFCLCPMQGIYCRLVSVPCDANTWSDKEIRDFDSRVAALELSATFCSFVGESKHIYDVMLRLPDGSLLNKEYAHSGTQSPCPQDDFKPITSPTEPLDKDTVSISVSNPDACTSVEKIGGTDEVILTTKKVNIEQGSTMAAFMSYAENPNNFSVHLANCEEILENIQKCVDELAEKDFAIEELDINSPCVAQSPDDGVFYRGQITDADSDQATVLFVDYGNKCQVKWARIRPVTSDLLELPAQAIPCHLMNIPKYTSEKSIKAAIDEFLNLTLDQELVVTFVNSTPTGCWEVEVEVRGKNLSQMLKDIETDAKQEQCSSSNSEDDSSDETDTSSSSDECSDSDEPESSSGSSSVSSRDRKNFSSPRLSPIQPTSRHQHQNNPLGKSDTTKFAERKFLNGEIHKGVIISGMDTSQFFVRLESDPCIFPLLKDIIYPNEDKVAKGVCIAKLKPEDVWERADVFGEFDGTKTVLFVDNGKVINSKRFLTAAIPDNLLKFPAQAVCCNISTGNSEFINFCHGVLGQHVIITFHQPVEHQVSKFLITKWTVDISFLGMGLETFLTKKSMLNTQGDGSKQIDVFEPAAISTPLLPEILITNDQGSSQTHGKENTAMRKPDTGALTSHVHRLQNLIRQGASQEQLLRLTDNLMVMACSISKVKALPTAVGADGDKNTGNADSPEDHKRPSSPAHKTLESPCKKIRLDTDAVTTQPETPDLSPAISQPAYHIYKELPKHTIRLGDVHEAFVSHITSPDSFYIKPCFLLSEENVCDIGQCPQRLETIKESCLCAVKQPNECSYSRCVVVSLCDDQVTVLNIDTGKSIITDAGQIYVLPESCKVSPPLAVCCSLAGIRSVNQTWTVEAIKCFQEIVFSDTEESVRVEFLQTPNEANLSWKVKIRSGSSDVSQSLVGRNHAIREEHKTDENFNQGNIQKPNKEKSAPLLDIGPSFQCTVPLPPMSVEEDIGARLNPDTFTITPKLLTMSSESSLSVISDSVFASENDSSAKNVSPEFPKKLSWSIYHSSAEQDSVEQESISGHVMENLSDIDTEKGTKEPDNEDDKELQEEIDKLVEQLVNSSLSLNKKFSVFSDSQDESKVCETSDATKSWVPDMPATPVVIPTGEEKTAPSEKDENEDDQFVKIAEKIVEQICNRAIATVVNSQMQVQQVEELTSSPIEGKPADPVTEVYEDQTDEQKNANNCDIPLCLANNIAPTSVMVEVSVPKHEVTDKCDLLNDMPQLVSLCEESAGDPVLHGVIKAAANQLVSEAVDIIPDSQNSKCGPVENVPIPCLYKEESGVPDKCDLLNDMPSLVSLCKKNAGNPVFHGDIDADAKQVVSDLIAVIPDVKNSKDIPDHMTCTEPIKSGDDPTPKEFKTDPEPLLDVTGEEDLSDVQDHKPPLINVYDETTAAEDEETKAMNDNFSLEIMKNQYLSTPKHEENRRVSEEISVYSTPLSVCDKVGGNEHCDVTLTHSSGSEASCDESQRDDLLFVSARNDSQ